MIASNSSPLIHLARSDALGLLKEIFGEVAIPRAVYQEVVERGKELKLPDASKVEFAMKAGWIRLVRLKKEKLREAKELGRCFDLGRGEIEAIMLAKQINTLLLIDERPARRVASTLGIKNVGTLGVILRAVELGMLNKEKVREKVRKLIEGKFFIEPSLLMDILEKLK